MAAFNTPSPFSSEKEPRAISTTIMAAFNAPPPFQVKRNQEQSVQQLWLPLMLLPLFK